MQLATIAHDELALLKRLDDVAPRSLLRVYLRIPLLARVYVRPLQSRVLRYGMRSTAAGGVNGLPSVPAKVLHGRFRYRH
jgi:hypothetical protein